MNLILWMYGPETVNVASGEPVLHKKIRANAWRLHSYPQWKDHPLRVERGFEASLPALSFPVLSDAVCGSSNCASLNITRRLSVRKLPLSIFFWDDNNVYVDTSWRISWFIMIMLIVKFITNRGWANIEFRLGANANSAHVIKCLIFGFVVLSCIEWKATERKKA